jgi:hypothetical protein
VGTVVPWSRVGHGVMLTLIYLFCLLMLMLDAFS